MRGQHVLPVLQKEEAPCPDKPAGGKIRASWQAALQRLESAEVKNDAEMVGF